MDVKKLNDIFLSDFNVEKIVAVRQTWRRGEGYDYFERSRRQNGFLLLSDHGATVEYPDGSVKKHPAYSVLLLTEGSHYAISFPDVPQGKTEHPLLFNFDLTDDNGKRIELEKGVARLRTDGEKLRSAFTSCAEKYRESSFCILKAEAYRLFSLIFPLNEEDECALRYIKEHLSERIGIPGLAKRCAMSESAFRARFKELTGTSPVKYINKIRIEKACAMLCCGEMSVSSVSDYLKFYSVPYFYKVFREYKGVTPVEYRENEERRKRGSER